MSVKQLTWEEAVQWLRDQPDRKQLAQACYYDDPLQTAAERFSNSEEWQAVTQLLKDRIPGQVLDIGAGRGISSYAFAKSGYRVTALEPNSSQIVGAGAIQTLADSSSLPISVVQEWGETLPFADNTFDVVYGRAVLHHARDLDRLCKEAARVLKPNGYFLATREHVISKQEDLQQFLDSHPLHSLYGGENAYLLEQYTNAINLAGLKIHRTIAPLESVINYAPMTEMECQNLFRPVSIRRLGHRLGSKLADIKMLQNLYIRYASNRLDSPGRLYSFLAVKP
ncbi:class I SAM-dependent methyltransferase [Chamaesiphon sp. VAR_48_metabat_403]|uniref:class I SAM-dependent methyltransferase n=1 Tax=Chamaesiphon sp. VAR_48_metabat_403 TaxID=2964700 RepID=UPI00286E7057|nr:class I SAM-dependent methyltransferase [Chamaesiphon sp. VAR_48_metabat_403]